MTRYELECILENQQAIMLALQEAIRQLTNEKDPILEERLTRTKQILKLIDDQGKAGRQ